MANNVTGEDLLYFNGVNGTTGKYDLKPMTVGEFAETLLRQPLPSDEHAAGFYENFIKTPVYGLADDRDPKKIEQAGWGVIFARDEDPAVIEALEPLLKLRREQAGDYYYEYAGSKGKRRGYFPGETKEKFLEGREAEPFGPADPKYAPYYLLIVGDPEKIPFKFQYQLDIQYAVGRIHFRSPEEYAQYAQNVVMVEKERKNKKLRLPREAVFFGVEHHENDATYLSANHLVKPLMKQLQESSEEFKLGWGFKPLLKDHATKANLSSLLNGTQTPALLFTASHGVPFNPDDARQEDRQGALLCQDWQGEGGGKKLEDCYFCAEDVESNANLLGLMAFHFACYSAGTPRRNNFLIAHDKEVPPITAQKDFVARLPHRLMLNGALAVIGHLERAWGVSIVYTSKSLKDDRHLATYRSTMRRLMDGHPVGSALEYFNEKYGEYSAALSNGVEARELKLEDAPDDYELVRLWRANNDARNYIILGDPAARLPVADVGEKPIEERPELSRIMSVTSPAQPPAMESDGADAPPESSERVAESPPMEEHVPSFMPPPSVPIDLAEKDPTLYTAWRDHIITGFKQNNEMFSRILNAFMGAYNTTVTMYKILFGVGITAFLVAAVLSIWTQQATFGLIFGGLSAVSFLSYFLSRPLQSLEQNLQFITWLGVVYNTYWTRLVYMMDQSTVQKDLEDATNDTIKQIEHLIDRYTEMSGQRPGLK